MEKIDIYIASDESVDMTLLSCYRIVSSSGIHNEPPASYGEGPMPGDMEASEIKAAIHALSRVYDKNKSKEITIHINSEHLTNAMTSWIKAWQNNGWKKKDGQPLVNAVLWQKLNNLVLTNVVTWKYFDKEHITDDNPHEVYVLNTLKAFIDNEYDDLHRF